MSLETLMPARWLVELLFVAYVLVGILLVILERRHPRTTLAWVLAIILLPILGMLAYLLIGRRPYRRHVRRCRLRREAAAEAMSQLDRLDSLPDELRGPERGLVQLALRSAAAPLRRARDIELLGAGPATLDAICAAIEEAEQVVHLEFYIWRDDGAGRRLTALLARRAREGIQVRVLCDHVGSFGLPRKHFAELLDAGGEIAFFAPIFVPSLRRLRTNFRNHRKLISIDRRVGFVGGLNVADEYLAERSDDSLWEDLFVRLEGSVVIGLETIFTEDWLDARPDADESELRCDEPPVASADEQDALVQVIASGPDARVETVIAAQFSAAIAQASWRCWIATPYLVPDEPLKLTLMTAAMRGVDVRLIVPERSDQWLVTMASASYFDTLIEAGCRIYNYPHMLHSKYLLADDSVAAIGSANMDVRSFHLNYEVTAMFYDARVNRALAEVFERDLALARPIGVEERAQLPAWRHAAESVARVVAPLL
jgi:cardiolipin synthase